jgi:predicted adenine nucleotide alpha hydrolase (AANH) superfamily ATPase
MKFCENVNCEYADEWIERVSDYRIIDGAVICTYCYDLEIEAQEETAENQPDYDYQL